MTEITDKHEPPVAGPVTPAGRAMLGLIRLYQLTLSAVMGRTCRHMPSCSEYAAEAVRRHGAWRGFWLGFSRVARCHPWGSHGLDPVPDSLPDHGWRFWRYGRWTGRHITERFED
ncbi:membrane protein insertion efficiency factor YidD [Kaustia mangrovi]|uniref:Putative membrane protein insertion efficiency factor n=1 Tax=Kaustia mangrovi TaxID=2593653 RepID=A0A7S8C0S1_9HYPH|nr:membrane protein insertion efficiency factor YidD [Kaustia mangrovi]QPC41288.1 membrane protein insertion efficiency factor YidD [Kaustia mangrovi]